MIENNKKGFTMIELVTVIVVLSILSLFTFSFIEHASKTYLLGKGQSALYLEGVYIMERITRELSDAKTVDTAVSSTLTFTTAAHPSPPSGFLARTATTVTFQQVGGDLFRISNGNTIIIGRNIKTFNVTKSAVIDGIVTVYIELELNSPDGTSIPDFVLRTKITQNNYTGGYTGRSFNGDYYEGIKQ